MKKLGLGRSLIPIAVKIGKGALYGLYAAHWLGCLWFLITDLERERGDVNQDFIIGGFTEV